MTDLVLHEQCFSLAERIAQSGLIPSAYRNKPADAAIAMMYGGEMGLPPMTALQRVVVISGKPTLDAQGMVALIRSQGHSIQGEVTEECATVTGRRSDTGDTMTSTFSMDDAKMAGLAGSQTYKKFPKDMLWARAVSQLGRRLFADVLMGASYSPEEMEAVVAQESHVEAENVIDAEVIEGRVTADQIHRLSELFELAHIAPDDRKAFAAAIADRDLERAGDLTSTEADAVIAALDDMVAPFDDGAMGEVVDVEPEEAA